jgi:hypothetical protein
VSEGSKSSPVYVGGGERSEPEGVSQSPDVAHSPLSQPASRADSSPARWGAFENFRALIRRSLAARLLTIAIVSVLSLMAMGVIAHSQFNVSCCGC